MWVMACYFTLKVGPGKKNKTFEKPRLSQEIVALKPGLRYFSTRTKSSLIKSKVRP